MLWILQICLPKSIQYYKSTVLRLAVKVFLSHKTLNVNTEKQTQSCQSFITALKISAEVVLQVLLIVQMQHKWAVRAADVLLFQTPHLCQKGNQFYWNRCCFNLLRSQLKFLVLKCGPIELPVS